MNRPTITIASLAGVVVLAVLFGPVPTMGIFSMSHLMSGTLAVAATGDAMTVRMMDPAPDEVFPQYTQMQEVDGTIYQLPNTPPQVNGTATASVDTVVNNNVVSVTNSIVARTQNTNAPAFLAVGWTKHSLPSNDRGAVPIGPADDATAQAAYVYATEFPPDASAYSTSYPTTVTPTMASLTGGTRMAVSNAALDDFQKGDPRTDFCTQMMASGNGTNDDSVNGDFVVAEPIVPCR